MVRSSELSLVVVAVVVGVLAGLGVAAMTELVDVAHVVIYGIPFDVRLSAAARVSPVAAFTALPLGGLAVGLIDHWRRARKLPRAVDPIEANALRGGRMAIGESLIVCAQTVISNGSGASVGLESGYAQIGGAIASRLGLALRLRRQDLRLLVGCGAGGAIAAAFGAPLTGAFYASELIIGAYSLANAGPIFAAALAATLTTKALLGAPYVIVAPPVARADPRPSLRPGGAGSDIGGDRRRRDARRRAARTRLRGDARAALGASRARRLHPGGDGALYAANARRRTRRDRARLFGPAFRCDLGDAARAEAEREPHFARVGLSRRPVLRLAVRRRAARQALRARRRRRAADARARPDRLHHGGHGNAERRGGRRAADDDLPGAGEHRRPQRGGRRAGGEHRCEPRRAGDLRLFLHHVAPPPARRIHSRRAGRRLAARPDRRRG